VRHVTILVAATIGLAAAGQSPPPLSDTRLTVHTLLREDIFAGVLDGDMERLARGEKNIETLLASRPADKPGLLTWKASTILYRGVLALEAKRAGEFDEKYSEAMAMLTEAKKLGPNDPSVDAATAGQFAILADRLPAKLRADAWSRAYDSYRALWKLQAGAVKGLPVHLRGELLAGLAQSAQRTGRTAELNEYLDKILDLLPDTPYARVAKEWKEEPKTALTKRITCLTCHGPGRLAARQAALK
jgi:tetratricopeptide (TPR) repeat protein